MLPPFIKSITNHRDMWQQYSSSKSRKTTSLSRCTYSTSTMPLLSCILLTNAVFMRQSAHWTISILTCWAQSPGQTNISLYMTEVYVFKRNPFFPQHRQVVWSLQQGYLSLEWWLCKIASSNIGNQSYKSNCTDTHDMNVTPEETARIFFHQNLVCNSA